MKIKNIEIKSNKKEFLDALNLNREAALEAIGLIAERYAKDGARVDTGRLRNSITHATAKYSGAGNYKDNNGKGYSDATARNTPENNAVYIGTNVEYAPYIELGSSRSKNKYPFIQPAVQNHIDEYRKIIESALKD